MGAGSEFRNYATPFLEDKILGVAVERKYAWRFAACFKKTDRCIIAARFNSQYDSFQSSFFASADS